MTTENAAILFTDVVGSTELSQRLSAEGADEVRRAHFSVLRQAIAQAEGSEVKNLGDGLMVSFSKASAALACAVAMQQGVDLDNRDRDDAVGLRVGLSMGEASREDDDYFGDPVIEAARLCAKCETNQILTTGVVRSIAGRRSPHEYHSHGEMALKGLPDPVEAVEVLWEPIDESDKTEVIPLPARLSSRPAVGVVGREAEKEALTDAMKRVTSGEEREIVLVSGEAGIGKTTLVAEAARSAFDNGACVLLGHCEEDLVIPYKLFAEALGHYVAHASETELRAHIENHGSDISRLVPGLARRIPDLPASKSTDSESERHLLFAAVVGMLATLSENQPVVLILDDIQWADKASLALLKHLAAAGQSMRVLVLGTFRDSELSRSHPLLETLGALRRLHGVSRIELKGLDDTAVLAFLEASAGHSLEDAGVGLAHALYRETDGNPFFVDEVLRHLVETGAIYQDATGRWAGRESFEQMALPVSVREVIGGRVARLGEKAERVLSMAAVIGRDFDLDLLAKTTKTDDDELLDILEAGEVVSLVRELVDTPGRYSFCHALIQHTLYEDLGPTHCARAHRRVAEALEELCGDNPGTRVGELARHWTNATQPVDQFKAVRYSREAGDAALAALAPADALRYYSQALNLYPQIDDPDPVLALDLAIGLGTAQCQTGDPAFRDTLVDAARRAAGLGDTERLVAAALANNRGLFSTAQSRTPRGPSSSPLSVVDTDKVEILEMVIERLPADDPNRALMLASLCAELGFGTSLERRQALADEALGIARSSGDDAITVRVLNDIVLPLMVPSLHEQSLALTAEALALAERIGDQLLLFFAAHDRMIVAHTDGDIDEIDRCLEIERSTADQLEQPLVRWAYTFASAARALIAGDTDRAEELATAAIAIGTDNRGPEARVIFSAQFGSVQHQRGKMDELIPIMEEMITKAPERSAAYSSGLALAYAQADRTGDATRLLDEFAAADFSLPEDLTWYLGMVCYAGAAIVVGDPKYAGPLFDRLVPCADRVSTTGATSEGPIALFLGGLATVLGRYEEANAYFYQSSSISARMGAKFSGARTDLLWGKMLGQRRAPSDIERAREVLRTAHETAVAQGYADVERRSASAMQELDG